MPKTALVLSGGGAKGAFQFMAEKYAREVKGYSWDLIAGVSVGALNGAMLSMKSYDRLEYLWKNISNDQVYTGKMNILNILWRFIIGAKSIHGNEPLKRLIDQEFANAQFRVPLRIGIVSLSTGEYEMLGPDDLPADEFRRAILASTAIPIIWPPTAVNSSRHNMVDGGVRNISPLGDVLDEDPDEIVIINCSPQGSSPITAPLGSILDIGKRTLDMLMNEILVTDIREFIRINKNVLEAKDSGLVLHNEDGKPFKFYKHVLIEPGEDLGDTLDFSKESIQDSMDAGWETAKRVLGS